MADDWIKMRHNLVDDPAVIAMSRVLKKPDYAIVGLLHCVWCWADRQTSDGRADGVTPEWIDRKLVNVRGFAEAMANAGWLVIEDDGLSFPGFDRHNGASAKKRMLAARRKAKQNAAHRWENHDSGASQSRTERDKSHAPSVTEAHQQPPDSERFCHAPSVAKRKRREEKRKTTTNESSETGARASSGPPDDPSPPPPDDPPAVGRDPDPPPHVVVVVSALLRGRTEPADDDRRDPHPLTACPNATPERLAWIANEAPKADRPGAWAQRALDTPFDPPEGWARDRERNRAKAGRARQRAETWRTGQRALRDLQPERRRRVIDELQREHRAHDTDRQCIAAGQLVYAGEWDTFVEHALAENAA